MTALLGTLTAIAATVRLAPAEAMRPLAPGRYRRSLLERVPRLRTSPALRIILRNIERRPLRSALTTGGIAAAVAIVVMGNFFRDAIEVIVDANFTLAMRGDIAVWTTDPVDASAARALARIPGVLQVEPGRSVAVRFMHGARSESGAIQGYATPPQLRRIIDVDLKQRSPSPDGLLMTDRLADKLGLRVGDTVTVEVREGRRPVRQIVVERTVRDMMGLNAYMDRQALNRLLGDGNVATLFNIAVEQGTAQQVLQATQAMPRVAGAFSKATMLRNMQEVSARNILIMSTILTVFAGVIAVGVVYNNALVELMRSDQFFFPVVIRPRTYAWAALCVVGAGLASALVVRRRIDRLDMVAALKTRE